MPIQFRIGNGAPRSIPPLLGCLPLFLALSLLCVLPFFLYDTAKFAFERLDLSPGTAAIVVLGMVLGSFVNIPVYHIRKDELQPQSTFGPLGMGMERTFQRVQSSTLIAVNLGGCVIPTTVAVMQLLRLIKVENGPILATLVVTAISIVVCWRVAKPMVGVGILIPGFIPPLVSVLSTWVLLWDAPPWHRAATAFIAGVFGPLIGADLLNLRKMMNTPVAVMSIGGAGSFDGIVLSGVLAALLA